MDTLFEKYYRKADNVPLIFQRSLLNEIDWNNQLIGIKGARGAGKTTLLFQHILLNHLPGYGDWSLCFHLCRILYAGERVCSYLFTHSEGSLIYFTPITPETVLAGI